jgi:hypothetical protein
MNLTPQQAREMAQLIGLDIPEADLEGIALRLSSLLTAMEAIESELGAVMDKTEPIPPVYPHEPEG